MDDFLANFNSLPNFQTNTFSNSIPATMDVSPKIKAIVIDDEADALTRMEYILDKFPEIEVLKYLADPTKAVAIAKETKPDLVFVDVEMPNKSGFDVVKDLRDTGFKPHIIFVTAYNQYSIKAIKAEAFDFLLKPVAIDELRETLERYKEKNAPKTSEKLTRFALAHKLTEREVEIIELLLQNKSSKEIGVILELSRHTVDTHRRRILGKVGVKDTAEIHRVIQE